MNSLDITSLDLELTQLCNLDCPYCYLGRLKHKGTITDEILEMAAELLARFGTTKKTKGKKVTSVTFYGGEPLLAFDKIEKFVSIIKNRGYDTDFHVISNGTIYDPKIIAYCNERNISVQRSLDGCPEAMALCRGEKTIDLYNKATPFWKDYRQGRRTTVIPQTAKYLLEDLQYFRKLGFNKGFSPIPDYYAEWKPEHVQDFKDSLWKLAEDFIRQFKNGRFIYIYWFEKELARFQTGRRSPIRPGCGAARGLHCISWNGYLFPCHRFTNEPLDGPYCAGHIKDVLAGTAKGFGKEMTDCLAKIKEGKTMSRCNGCIGQYRCCVGCYHSNLKCTGNLNEPPFLYCEIKRESAKVINYIDNQLRKIDPNWWDRNARNKKNQSK